jgi:hypothetical protein
MRSASTRPLSLLGWREEVDATNPVAAKDAHDNHRGSQLLAEHEEVVEDKAVGEEHVNLLGIPVLSHLH